MVAELVVVVVVVAAVPACFRYDSQVVAGCVGRCCRCRFLLAWRGCC